MMVSYIKCSFFINGGLYIKWPLTQGGLSSHVAFLERWLIISLIYL